MDKEYVYTLTARTINYILSATVSNDKNTLYFSFSPQGRIQIKSYSIVNASNPNIAIKGVQPQDIEFNISSLPSGVYVVQVIDSFNKVYTTKLLLRK